MWRLAGGPTLRVLLTDNALNFAAHYLIEHSRQHGHKQALGALWFPDSANVLKCVSSAACSPPQRSTSFWQPFLRSSLLFIPVNWKCHWSLVVVRNIEHAVTAAAEKPSPPPQSVAPPTHVDHTISSSGIEIYDSNLGGDTAHAKETCRRIRDNLLTQAVASSRSVTHGIIDALDTEPASITALLQQNLPISVRDCVQQTDSTSCGWHLLRNMHRALTSCDDATSGFIRFARTSGPYSSLQQTTAVIAPAALMHLSLCPIAARGAPPVSPPYPAHSPRSLDCISVTSASHWEAQKRRTGRAAAHNPNEHSSAAQPQQHAVTNTGVMKASTATAVLVPSDALKHSTAAPAVPESAVKHALTTLERHCTHLHARGRLSECNVTRFRSSIDVLKSIIRNEVETDKQQ